MKSKRSFQAFSEPLPSRTHHSSLCSFSHSQPLSVETQRPEREGQRRGRPLRRSHGSILQITSQPSIC